MSMLHRYHEELLSSLKQHIFSENTDRGKYRWEFGDYDVGQSFMQVSYKLQVVSIDGDWGTTMRARAPMQNVSISPCGTHAVVVGRSVQVSMFLKTESPYISE